MVTPPRGPGGHWARVRAEPAVDCVSSATWLLAPVHGGIAVGTAESPVLGLCLLGHQHLPSAPHESLGQCTCLCTDHPECAAGAFSTSPLLY